ncbi:hypothetical protein [Mucilaginibacter rubeus]|uniref:Glycosyl-4,4'-diaponeurosporenoate acyltransferase n=1 Tax=Mucilaginibacter rubeus TaxID=2027860 RepID=A0A5C1HXV6_9SPHI|nr:hypothetical protein [Mucilaginibacter rubeus]QEM10757.1 hypothetical protein DEO27_012225 [Mucilaginibacter rubeus]
MNQFINFFWTILGFTAVVSYWVSAGLSTWFYLFLIVSIIPVILPQKVADHLQLSSNTKFYERFGIRFIRKFVQHGDFANQLARTSDPRYRVIRNGAAPANYLKTIMMYERYHFMCLIFFLLTSIITLTKGYYLQFLLITISNIFYNFYPILLQQYNRVRILKINRVK